MLADGGRNQRRVVVARAEIARTPQRTHDLRTDHALTGIGGLVAERLSINGVLDDLEYQQRHEAPIAARHREITPHRLLEVGKAHETRGGIDAIRGRNLLPRAAELALQQRNFAARVRGRGAFRILVRRRVTAGGQSRARLMRQQEVAQLAACAAQRRDADVAGPRRTVFTQVGKRHTARLAAADRGLQRRLGHRRRVRRARARPTAARRAHRWHSPLNRSYAGFA